MIRINYGIWSAAIVLLFVTHTVAFASSAGKGDYEAYNSKKLILTSDKKSTGKFFTGGTNRAPAHDTPASTCKCSKYIAKSFIHKLTVPSGLVWVECAPVPMPGLDKLTANTNHNTKLLRIFASKQIFIYFNMYAPMFEWSLDER